mmetsp:Transcript_16532/g.40408  ORF Transcript_16532/g.40408 Transcript_16532/m.40408 type:complete len:376 (+) Transcript_16532:106-1233(+)
MSAATTMRRSISAAIRRPPSTTTTYLQIPSSHQIRYMGIGRMIDMGGMPSGSSDNSYIRHADASKNSKLQAVAFDFETLTTFGKNKDQQQDNKSETASATTTTTSSSIKPDAGRIEQVASLLNVELPGTSSPATTQSSSPSSPPPTPNLNKLPNEDIRAKYARKLQGGLAGIELAKNQVENSLAKGDAPGYSVARKLAVSSGGAAASSGNNKWMAMSGTGVLLSYLSHRSIKLALLPNPLMKEKKDDEEDNDDQLHSMESLRKQLKDVVIDCIVDPTKLQKVPSNRKSHPAHQLLLEQQLLKEFDTVHPNAILVVSDKDPYLKAAKELGMLTCRLQKPNARRGNVSAHFNIPTLEQVQEVVNEINGISFNAVLNR